jgi:hypothetical protein
MGGGTTLPSTSANSAFGRCECNSKGWTAEKDDIRLEIGQLGFCPTCKMFEWKFVYDIKVAVSIHGDGHINTVIGDGYGQTN